MDSREEIEAEIALAINLSLRLKSREPLYGGWFRLFQSGIDPVMVLEGRQIPASALQRLLSDAAFDADAFDACSTLAGLQLHTGSDIDRHLREFASNILLGKADCPKRTSRSVGKGVRQDITRYIILKKVLSFFPMRKGKGLRTEDETRAKSMYPPDAFGLISKALTEANLPTTENQLQNLLRHPSKASIREVGDWAMAGH